MNAAGPAGAVRPSQPFSARASTPIQLTVAAMVQWRQNLFEAISRNAGRAVDFFGIPHNAVIELGTRVQL